MKKIFPLIIIFFIFTSGISVSSIKNKVDYKKDRIIFSEPIIEYVEDKILLKIENAGSWLRIKNYPMLPCTTRTYIFPFGTKIKNIETINSENIEYILDKDVILTPSPITFYSGMKIENNKDIQDYNFEIYPEDKIDYNIYSGIINNERVIICSINFYPIQYVSSENKILYSENIDLKISYENNYLPPIRDETYDMVIIAPKKFSNAIQPLINHKNYYGIETFLKTTEDIYNEYQGFDNAERIKYFIKDAIETKDIDYVLLIGGRNRQRFNWLVPVRYSNLDDESDFETSYVSDLYFADIYDGGGNFSSWDTDGNGIFAQWNNESKDILDLVPDIYLGRLPCRNTYEVKIIVDKIINYENSTYGEDWFNDMVVVGGDSAPGYEYYEGEEENAKALEYMSNFNGIKLWTSDDTLTGPRDVIDAVSSGCGFLFFDGHGNPSIWSTHPPDDNDTWITGLNNKDMPKLKNGDMLPITVVGGCHNGQFDVTILNILKGIIEDGLDYFSFKFYFQEWVPECWAWRLTRKINGGSIAIMAYTGLDWFAEGDYDEDGIPDCIQYFSGFANTNFFKNYGVNNITILGQAHTQTLIDYINAFPPMEERLDCKTVQEFALIGDPSLQIGGYT